MHDEYFPLPHGTRSFARALPSFYARLVQVIACALVILGLSNISLAQYWDSATARPAPSANSVEQDYWWLANQQQFSAQSQHRLANETYAPTYVTDSPGVNTPVQWQSPAANASYTSSLYNPGLNPNQAPSQSGSPLIQTPQQIMPEQINPAQLPSEGEMQNFLGTQPHGGFTGTQVNPDYNTGEPWTHQVLPAGLIYRSYLASDREARMRSFFFNEKDYGNLWDITLGGRVGLWRYGTTNAYFPEGWQFDLEGAAMPRLDFEHDMNVVSTDFRAGLPITYGVGPWRTKLGYYHLSSHLGDEHLLTFPNTPRYNYSRDALLLGQSYYITPDVRIYAETSWAFHCDVAKEWEFQFGMEYAPALPTGTRGAPFAAINAHLREEVNYGGNLVLQAGWAWREGPSAHLLRVGVEYFNGKSDQYQFWNQSEQKIGGGIWYDF